MVAVGMGAVSAVAGTTECGGLAALIDAAGAVWSRPFFFGPSFHVATQTQSVQAEPAATSHPDPVAGDRENSRRLQSDTGWRHRHHPVPACPWRSLPSG